MKKLKPELKPHIGCLNCGCGEMKRDEKEITAAMNTRIYNGFGGWSIHKDGKLIYEGDCNGEWEGFPTLMKFERMAGNRRGTGEQTACYHSGKPTINGKARIGGCSSKRGWASHDSTDPLISMEKT